MNQPTSDQHAERQRSLDAVLDSDSRRKVIVAGPGAGKTYTLERALERVASDRLVLTFSKPFDPSLFLTWLDPHLERVYVNAASFEE